MKIRKIQIKNGYKRFHDLTIDLGDNPKRIVALIGPNGCGKSSVFDAMLFHNNAFGPIGNKGGKDHFYHSMTQSPGIKYDNINITLKDADFRALRHLQQQSAQQNTIFSFRSPYRYNNHLKIQRTNALPELRLNNYGATATNDIDDKMEINYQRLQNKYNKYLNETDSKPSEAKLKIIGDLNLSIQNCLNIKIESLGDIASNQGTIYFSKPDHPNFFEFNVLSSGEKEVVDLILDIYLRQDEYIDSIYLFDEPELHINTSIQKKLLLEINKLIPPNCQIWIATHSIGFLRALQDELRNDCQIIEFQSGINFASTIQTLNPIPMTRSNWKNIFSTALDDLTGLLSPKKIIYCEGKDLPSKDNSERGLDAIVLNNIFTLKYNDTVFVSSGGNTELEQRSQIAIKILSKVFSEMEILILRDRDISSGKPNTENDRQVYLQNNPSYHRVFKRWEIENYLYDKEVLNKYCGINKLVFNEIEYDKFVVDIFNQNLKDETGRIKNFCGITTSVNPEKFKIELSKVITEDMKIFSELEKEIFERK